MSDAERKRELARERNRRWRQRHLEQAREMSRKNVARWRAENPERARAESRAYYAIKREAILAQKRAHYQQVRKPRDATPEGRLKDLNKKHRRRAAQSDGIVTAEQWAAILEEYDHRCAYCDRGDLPLTQDHVIPLSKGGKHCASNIVPACRPCNSAKGNR